MLTKDQIEFVEKAEFRPVKELMPGHVFIGINYQQNPCFFSVDQIINENTIKINEYNGIYINADMVQVVGVLKNLI